MARLAPGQYNKLSPRLRTAVTEFVAAKYFRKNKTSSVSVHIMELKKLNFEGLGRYQAASYVPVRDEYLHKTVGGLLSEISNNSYDIYIFIAQQMELGIISVHDEEDSKCVDDYEL